MTVTDQMGRQIFLEKRPERIVSLVPSQTELLADLGLGERVVGITKFCIHPTDWFREKARVGGTKTVDVQRVAALAPDLIIGNKEENERGQIEQLAARWPVWMSDISTLGGALGMISRVGELTGTGERAALFSQKIREDFDGLAQDGPPRRAAYFIWRKPWMVAASGTFIDHMMGAAGFQNVFSEKSRYPEVSLDELSAAAPEVVLLSSEPFPFKEKHVGEFRAACPKAAIIIAEGEMFSWYGTRLLRAAAYFRTLKVDVELALAPPYTGPLPNPIPGRFTP